MVRKVKALRSAVTGKKVKAKRPARSAAHNAAISKGMKKHFARKKRAAKKHAARK